MSVLKKKYLERFAIAGFSYYEGCIAFRKLEIGTKLKLKAEPTNRFDKNAVEIYYKKRKLGYIPKSCNRTISKMLQCGIDVFEVRVQRLCACEYPENQVEVILYIKPKN